MFKINYRITTSRELFNYFTPEEIDAGGHIEGFFQIVVNNASYGDCPQGIIPPDYSDQELLTIWFEHFLQLLTYLKSGHEYLAMSDIDSYNSWLEFSKIDTSDICISRIYSEGRNGISSIIFEPPKDREYKPEVLHKQIVSLAEMEKEIKLKASQYFDEINVLNSELATGGRILKLKKLLFNLNIS
jgi:hypothetical protein